MAKVRDPIAETLIEREKVLRGQRSRWESLWESIARYMLPDSATFVEKPIEGGIERNRWVLDSTAPRALELFASFLHTMLNNPAAIWFKPALPEDKQGLLKSPEVKTWLEENTKRVLSAMASKSSNLYLHLHQAYLDEGAFGTAVLFSEWRDGLRYRHYHLDDCVIEENEKGFVDVMHRKVEMTPRQIRQRWPGKNLGPAVEDRLKKGGKALSERVTVMHSVLPTDDPEIRDFLPDSMLVDGRPLAPFVGFWVNTTDRLLIAVGSFEEFPYHVPRWIKARNEIYGRSPGMTALMDTRMANRMRETILRGAEKLVDPPLILPDGGIVTPVRLFPGGITFTEGEVTPQPLIPPGASRIEVGEGLLQQVQRSIERAFFVPLFVTEDSPVKTATQVLQEVDERNRAVSPMLIRQQSELFHPLIRRTWNLMERHGQLTERPAALVGVELEIEYQSPLIASQREMDALAILRLFETTAPWAQVDPGVFDHFDPDEISKTLHEASGAPAKLLRKPAQVAQIRQQRAQQAQQEQQSQLAIEGGNTAANLIKAQAAGRK